MDTIPCPGCRTALEPSATVCPICLRPRGKLEITRAYATLRANEKQRRKRPFVLAGYLLAAAATGWALYHFHAPLLAAASSARARAGRFVNDSLYPPSPPQPAAPPPTFAPEPSPETAPIFAAAPPTYVFAPAPDAPASPAAPVKAARHRRVEDLPFPPFNPDSQWVFYGRVFDLITLRPIADAQLNFTIVGGANQRSNGSSMNYLGARSDEEGRFVAVLSRLSEGSYEIHGSRSGYESPALYEPDIPYATLPLSDRREIVRNAQDGDMPLPPLSDVSGEESTRRDVFLAPSR